jgi:hypothetical protein
MPSSKNASRLSRAGLPDWRSLLAGRFAVCDPEHLPKRATISSARPTSTVAPGTVSQHDDEDFADLAQALDAARSAPYTQWTLAPRSFRPRMISQPEIFLNT